MATEKEYKISIDPRILELLGPSLYTNVYFILAELIANAYDANASNVYIIQRADCLIVEDDGTGMSYEGGDIVRYLNVAQETRRGDGDVFVEGSEGRRKKMGRKGVGKLAALSVSSEVQIKTIKNGEKSGFVLSRHVEEDHLLKPIPDTDIEFEMVSEHGTAVVMQEPQYKLHVTMPAIKNNLLKIFPFVDEDFRIHVHVDGREMVIDSFEKELIQGLGSLIILGEPYHWLAEHFDSRLGESRNEVLLKKLQKYVKKITMETTSGQRKQFPLEICGWIGAYRSTKERKLNIVDFPDNFISLFSNGKLGEYSILPVVGKNAMSEVYVVGQLHVDLFEETSLPDMALSNRQGYKSDDVRYQEVIKYVRNELLPQVIALRTKFAAYKKEDNEREINKKNSEREQELRRKVEIFKNSASDSAVKSLSGISEELGLRADEIKLAIEKSINMNLPDMGLKKTVDEKKKKLLISHAKVNKTVCDFIYSLLIFNGIPAKEILYTSSDNPDSVISSGTDIFDYLREFFVESISTEKIYVVYVTSEEMAKNWNAVSEVGAGWITKSTHEIFNINQHEPKKPLNVNFVWANLVNDSEGNIQVSLHEANRIVEKVELITKALDYKSKSAELLMAELKKLAEIVA